jgi:triosephosphate isomerase (TIM)
MKSIVVANWKMNPASFIEAKKLFEATKKTVDKCKDISLIIAPPAIYLQALSAKYSGTKISFALQNGHFEAGGAYTGETSITQASVVGASYVLVGHSERRAIGETGDDTRKKVSATLSLKMTPILCIGEVARTSSGEHFSIIAEQLLAGIKDVPSAKISKVIVAYEPVWAIGGETTMSPRDMHTMAIFIRKTIVGVYGEVGHKVRILYGAAVGEKNAVAMMKEGNVRGFIVGHVSQNVERFTELLKVLQKET